ncbi:MAG TPA: alpha/beta hydrolase, partial [Acidimicrobiales bacterium]
MPIAHVNGVDLFYELSGSGPRLLVCNGSGMTLASARPLLSLLGRDVTLLAYDPRGLGASGPAPGPYTMATCAADALGLLDAVGWDTTRVVGVSFGGMVAQELAVTAPDRVERLALLCTSPGGDGGSSYPLHQLEALDPDARASVRQTLLDDRFDEAWLGTHPGDRALVALMDRRGEEGVEIGQGGRVLDEEGMASVVGVELGPPDPRGDGLRVGHRGDRVEPPAADERGAVDGA